MACYPDPSDSPQFLEFVPLFLMFFGATQNGRGVVVLVIPESSGFYEVYYSLCYFSTRREKIQEGAMIKVRFQPDRYVRA